MITNATTGRPAIHASAAARQKAWREANKPKTVRLTGKSGQAVTGLAAYFDCSETEVINHLVKFALTNRDWKAQGLTGWASPDKRFKTGRAPIPQAPEAAPFVTDNSTIGWPAARVAA